jgi:phospholipid/cholesterol/gamma-HCH transport system substrate-binding protein
VKVSKEVKVGILAVVSLVIFYLGINFLKGIDFFRPNNIYFAIYNDIDGLAVSNPVLINDDILLGDSTVALLISSDFLGSKAINLEVGNVLNPKQDEDTLISRIDKSITEVIKDKAMPVVENINVSIAEANKLLTTLADNRDKMNNIFESFERTSRNVELMASENRANINKITANLNQLTETLNHPENGIKPLMASLSHFADSLNHLELKQTVDQTNQAMLNLSAMLDNINQGQGTIGKLAKDDSLYTNLNRSVRDLDRLLNDVRENPKRYVNFSIF